MPNEANGSLIPKGLLLGLMAAGVAACASMDELFDDDVLELQAFSANQVRIEQAIGRAEDSTGARAASAEFELWNGRGVFLVETVGAESAVTDVVVDGRTGEVLYAGPHDALGLD